MLRNLRLYTWYQFGISFYAWMPVFFLYFGSKVNLSQVFLLESIYYASVFIFEVPSGYFSDRVGRKPTLVLAAASLVLAYFGFWMSSEFWHLALAQVFLAIGLAFNSGTDTVFHLDTLTDLNRADEYGAREARISRLMFIAGALSAIAGGLLASFDLSWAYVASGLMATISLGAALLFKEPKNAHQTEGIFASLKTCYMATFQNQKTLPSLWWLALFWVCAVVVNHLPYEFYQPYFESLAQKGLWSSSSTPIFAGAHAAVVQLIAALIAGGSIVFARRVGLKRVLISAMALQALVMTSMVFSSPMIAAALAFRSVPRALQDAPIREAITPRVPAHVRATYLSLLSLVGRFGFSGVLILLAWWSGDVLSKSIYAAAILSWVLVAAVLVALLLNAKLAVASSQNEVDQA